MPLKGTYISPYNLRIPVLSTEDTNAIIAIINDLTGLSDTTYQSALSHLVIQQGGIGEGSILELLNELENLTLVASLGTVSLRLNMEIVTVGDNKYFKASTGSNVLITGYDFPDGWTHGFPYKSAATIDINGQTGVPVVSLFQNFDYENTMFCKHKSQVLAFDGSETTEPYVSEIVIYSAPLTGSNLTKANTYFGTPTEVTAKWVSPSGNDTTGTGAKDAPYLTIQKAITEASEGSTIYVKTGAYTNHIIINNGLSIIGIGKVLKKTETSYNVRFTSSGCSISGFIIDNEGTHEIGITNESAGETINKCLVTNCTIWGYYSTDSTSSANYVRNCVFKTAAADEQSVYVTSYVNLIGCLFTGTSSQIPIACIGTSSDYETNVLYCRVRENLHGIIQLGLTGTFNVNYNYFDQPSIDKIFNPYNDKEFSVKFIGNYVNIPTYTSGNGIIGFTADDYTVNSLTIKDNTFVANTDYPSNVVILANYAKLLSVENNTFDCLKSATAIFVEFSNPDDVVLIKYNTILHKSLSAECYGILVGNQSTPQEFSCDITGNKILGYRFYEPSAGTDEVAHGGIFNATVLNCTCSYNYIVGCLNGICYKGKSTPNTLGKANILYNILIDTQMYIKGQRYVQVYGNTVINSPLIGIMINTNTDENPVNHDAKGCKVKNNIVLNDAAYTGDNGYLMSVTDDDTIIEFESDYNILVQLYGNNFAYKSGKFASLTLWKEEGFDINSKAENPILTKAVPAIIKTGINLGSDYQYGLDKTTVFPAVVTKKQPTTWQIGAYVQ